MALSEISSPFDPNFPPSTITARLPKGKPKKQRKGGGSFTGGINSIAHRILRRRLGAEHDDALKPTNLSVIISIGGGAAVIRVTVHVRKLMHHDPVLVPNQASPIRRIDLVAGDIGADVY